MELYYFLTLILTGLLTAVILRFLLPYLKSRKLGQKILDIGPRCHKPKEGTPTMGGLSFLIAVTVVIGMMLAIMAVKGYTENLPAVIATGLFALLNGCIGIIDDRTKFSKGKNEGLLSWQKYLLQLAVAILYLIALSCFDAISTTVYIPFFKTVLPLGWLYYPLAVLLLTGIVNSVNLTDGIDGLASSITAVVAAFFSVVAFTYSFYSLGIFAAATLGGCLGFLVYNFYPARVFMGDTGSLFLGGLVVGMAFMAANPLIIVIVGFVYLLETLSVILQVTYFKLTHGKRLFKMSPIHHHFEKCGGSEIKIVTVFSTVTLLLTVLTYLLDIHR
jgi:phospho-N-acetylmuramoyl-pentapeptide-transferase